jgi:hypothetical protein
VWTAPESISEDFKSTILRHGYQRDARSCLIRVWFREFNIQIIPTVSLALFPAVCLYIVTFLSKVAETFALYCCRGRTHGYINSFSIQWPHRVYDVFNLVTASCRRDYHNFSEDSKLACLGKDGPELFWHLQLGQAVKPRVEPGDVRGNIHRWEPLMFQEGRNVAA